MAYNRKYLYVWYTVKPYNLPDVSVSTPNRAVCKGRKSNAHAHLPEHRPQEHRPERIVQRRERRPGGSRSRGGRGVRRGEHSGQLRRRRGQGSPPLYPLTHYLCVRASARSKASIAIMMRTAPSPFPTVRPTSLQSLGELHTYSCPHHPPRGRPDTRSEGERPDQPS